MVARMHSKTRKKHRQFLEEFPVNQQKLGRMLSKGKQHYVYEYGSSQVVKIPRTSIYNKAYGMIDPSIIKLDLELLQTYCSSFIPKTKIYVQGKKYVIVQDIIAKHSFVTTATIDQVRPQLTELLLQGSVLYRDKGLFLDIFGYQGMSQSLLALLQWNKTRALLTNVIIDFSSPTNPKLYLVDTNLSSIPQKNHPANWFHRSVDIGTIALTKLLSWWAFGLKVT